MGLRTFGGSGAGRRLATAGLATLLMSGVAPAPVAAQPLPDDVRTIIVTGTGAATAPAETARIQFLAANYGDMGMGMGMMPAMEAPVAIVEEVVEPAEVAEAPPEGAATPDVSPAQPPIAAEVSGEESGWVGYVPVVNQLTDEQLRPLVDAVVEAGAPEDAVTVQAGVSMGGYFGPGAPAYGLVEVLLTDPTQEQVNTIVEAAQAAAGESLLPIEQIGVEYNVADCAPLVEAALAAAADDARARAEALAPHFGGSAGAPVQVADYASTMQPFDDGAGCPPTPDMMMGMYGPTSAFDTPPYNAITPAEARVLIQLSVTYELELASQ